MKTLTVIATVAAVVATIAIVKVPDWHRPGTPGTQMGFRASSMVQFASRAETAPINADVPAPLPAADTGGQKATEKYKNVKVLTDVSAAEFDRLQQAITTWVAPKQGCAFCHDTADFSSDAKPTKLAARRMLEMTRYVNSAWSSHVQPSGVTCYTCHRGQPIPAEVWWPRQPKPKRPMFEPGEPWNEAADTVSTFFPNAGYAEYFLQDNPIAGQSRTALRSNDVAAQVVVKRIYEMMMQMSLQIGVNCGYCHNSRALEDWSQSTPERWVGYYALRLIRDLNRNYLLPLAQVIPQQRVLVQQTAIPVIPDYQKGQQAGNALLTCETCHYRLPKPLNGVNMVKDYPGLTGTAPASKDADPHIELTRAALSQLQRADLAATAAQTGAMSGAKAATMTGDHR